MGRILVVVLGLGVVLGAAYYYLRERAAEEAAEPSAPAQRLENVRGAARRIEEDAARRADELLERSE